MAGLGIDTLEKHMITPRDWRKLAVRFVGVFAMLVVGLALIVIVRGSNGSSRTAAAAVRVLGNGCFWLALAAMATVILLASQSRVPRMRRSAGGLLGLLAMAELAWCGFALLSVAPADRFLDDDGVGAALVSLDRDAHRSGRIRIKARDSFYSDLQAESHGIQKTNINDVFQLEHAARLYQLLYPVAAFQRRRVNSSMQHVVDDYQSQVRQAVFDRLSVGYLVSNRLEPDPAWPLAARQNSRSPSLGHPAQSVGASTRIHGA